MSSFNDALENALLDHVFGSVDYTPPTNITVHLYTVAPTDSGGGTEVSTGVWTNYAAVSLTNNTTNFPAASGGAKSVGVDVDFGTATISGAAPTVVAMALKDGSTFLGWAPLAVNKTINNGDPVEFPAGDLDLSLA